MKSKANLLDRAIGYFSPEAGLKRTRARVMTAFVSDTTFTGASHTKRSLRNFGIKSERDPDDEVLPELETLRERSRDLYKNNPIGGGAIKTVKTHTIGSGLQLQSRIDREYLKKMVGLTDAQADEFESSAERIFNSWAWYTDADASRRCNFFELQDLAFLTFMQAGECITLLPIIPRPGTVSPVRVQLTDADRLSNPDGRMDDGVLYSGIEVDKYGAPTAYWIETTPPGFGIRRTWQKVTAFGSASGRQNVIHLYKQERPGQRRGVPFLTPVIEPLKQITRYADSELMAAVVSASFTVFIESETGDGDILGDAYADTGAPTDGDGEPGTEPDDAYQMGPGAIVGLDPGQKVQFANPGRPNSQFDPFMTANLRQIGMALEIPYEVLVKHFQSSYSAARGALMEAHIMFKTRRDWFATKWCQPIYEEILTDQILAGNIIAPGFFDSILVRRAYCNAEWIGPAPIQLDPTKEVTAAVQRIENKLSTKTAESMAMNGSDWNTSIRQLAKEIKTEKELGITATAKPATLVTETNTDPEEGSVTDGSNGTEENQE